MRRRRQEKLEIITQTYKGIELVFDKTKDHWLYTLRGHDRYAKSLGSAMKEIDKPAPKGGKPFEPVEVMRSAGPHLWSGDKAKFEKATVTSIANDRYSNDVWISQKGSRAKVRPDSCYLITPKNLNVMKSITDLSSKIATLEKLKSQLYDSLETLHIEKEEQ
jgi:hypothetical protein